MIRRHWWHLILGTFIMLATYVLFYLMTNFTLSYGTKPADLAAASAAAEAAAEANGSTFDATAFAAQFYPGLGFGYTDFVIMQIIGVVFFGIFTLLSGPLADRIGRRKLLLWVTGGIIVFGLDLHPVPAAAGRPEVHRSADPGVPGDRVRADGRQLRPDGRRAA